MLGNYFIGLREGLEASLVVGILVAYVVRTGRRGHLTQIWLGVGAAVALSLLLGAALTYGSSRLSFEAQEAIGGFLSIVAVGFVTWMIFWMASNARHLKGELHSRLDKAAIAGSGAIVLMAFVAVAREGLETALFVWSAVNATGGGLVPLLGALLGIATSVILGYLLYRGALRLNLAKFFKWSGVVLIIVAAGVLSYGVHDLQEAGILPGLNTVAFDVSGSYSANSWYAVLLKGTVNFTPVTTVLQAIAWVAYVVPVMWLFLRTVNGGPAPKRPDQSVAATSTSAQQSAVATSTTGGAA